MPGRDEKNEYGGAFLSQMRNKARSLYEQAFAEIYIEDGQPSDKVGIEPQPILQRTPKEEEKHRIFLEMRHMCSCVGQSGGFYTPQQSVSFYQQAKFMENFEDDYARKASFSMYFPDYQMMNFEQLRTYFTWRTKVRKGIVEETSFSYVFLYIYELINHIGIQNSLDGLEKLLFLWEKYETYEKRLSRYMAGWAKDYYIVNEIPIPFAKLVQEHTVLQEAYPNLVEEDFFEAYSAFSDYKFHKSIFYSEKTAPFIRECFNWVVGSLEEWLTPLEICLDDLLYYGHRGSSWQPFRKALYYPGREESRKDKVVKISYSEIYWRENTRWFSTKNRVKRENGRRIMGYIFRRIEQFYRKVEKFPHKLQADPKKINLTELKGLMGDCEGFFARIDSAILEFYKKSKKISLEVDSESLEKIRENSLITQEKLLAGMEESGETVEERKIIEEISFLPQTKPKEEPVFAPSFLPPQEENGISLLQPTEDPWSRFADSLSVEEKDFLRLILRGASMESLQEFARSVSLMPEILADGINEKALETAEDTVIEFSDCAEVFEDYRKDLERVMLCESK